MTSTGPEPRSRVRLLVALGVTVALGLGSRSGSALVPEFVALHAGDVLWTVAVYLVLALLRPAAAHLAILAFGVSLLVELSQLLDAPWLNAARDTTLGRLLLGAGWRWMDLVRYGVGALGAVAFDRLLHPGRVGSGASNKSGVA